MLLISGLTALRVIRLDLDAPTRLLRHYDDQAHYRDEAAKAHEARNMARFDRWKLSEADNYEFWRRQSPYWVYAEMLWFRAFGVKLVAARAFVVVHGVLALSLLFWLAWTRHGLPAALTSTLLLGANWAYLVLSRLALMEGVLIAWLIVASVGLGQLERRPEHAGRWILVALVGMTLACLTKQTALLLLPAFIPVLVVLGMRASGPGGWREQLRRWPALLAMVGALALVLGLAALLLDPAYQRRLEFNAAHFTSAREPGSSVIINALIALYYGLFGQRMFVMFMLLAPLPMWLATTELARLVALDRQRRRARRSGEPDPSVAPGEPGLLARSDMLELWMLAWALLALLANLASPHKAIRFHLLLVPPSAYLGGLLVARVWTQRWSSAFAGRFVRIAVIVLLVGSTSVTLARFVEWMQTGRRTMVTIGPELEALIGDRHAVVVGEFAAQAVMETGYWHFYVRGAQFNSKRKQLDALGITHLIARVEDDHVEGVLSDRVPRLLVGRRELGRVQFREHELIVWELAPQPPPRAASSSFGGRQRDVANQGQERKEHQRAQQPEREGPGEPDAVR